MHGTHRQQGCRQSLLSWAVLRRRWNRTHTHTQTRMRKSALSTAWKSIDYIKFINSAKQKAKNTTFSHRIAGKNWLPFADSQSSANKACKQTKRNRLFVDRSNPFVVAIPAHTQSMAINSASAKIKSHTHTILRDFAETRLINPGSTLWQITGFSGDGNERPSKVEWSQ